jgi:hypothetical protein
MRIPPSVTILWSDDNSGNIQRLPIASESTREGNAGVYYHFDYVGDPRNYKWINTIQLSKTWQQMHLAHQKNATEIWIVNVGDLKPLVSLQVECLSGEVMGSKGSEWSVLTRGRKRKFRYPTFWIWRTI